MLKTKLIIDIHHILTLIAFLQRWQDLKQVVKTLFNQLLTQPF